MSSFCTSTAIRLPFWSFTIYKMTANDTWTQYSHLVLVFVFILIRRLHGVTITARIRTWNRHFILLRHNLSTKRKQSLALLSIKRRKQFQANYKQLLFVLTHKSQGWVHALFKSSHNFVYRILAGMQVVPWIFFVAWLIILLDSFNSLS